MDKTNLFIEKARKIHGDKYDYSESEYINTNTKIKVICHKKDKFGDEHGYFLVTPHAHTGIMKSGCPKCSHKFRKDTEYFVKEAKLIHGDKYDYSKVKYKKALEDIEIICPKHGSFFITPNQHLSGAGCKKCGYETVKEKMSMTTNEFIKKAKKIHGDKYDYSKTDLEHRDEKGRVIITCKKHGEFWQNPSKHLIGQGCQKCKQSHLENEILNFLKKEKIENIVQKKFDWLGKQSLDFYLPQYNVAIECQGKQHFGIGNWNNKNFNIIEKRDSIKRKLCEENGIKLLYYSNLGIEYPYFVFENKEELLKEIKK